MMVESMPSSLLPMPWWESELPAVMHELRAYLHRKLPSLQDHHEDILNETLAALAEQLQRRSSAFPESWLAPTPVVSEEDRKRFHGFVRTILTRRIADLFRARASEWGRRVENYDFDKEPDHPSLERKILLQQMLQICVEVLANSPKEDRALLALIAGADQRSQDALEPSERQRLRRLRQKLSHEISRRLGATVSELLREID